MLFLGIMFLLGGLPSRASPGRGKPGARLGRESDGMSEHEVLGRVLDSRQVSFP